MKYHIIIFLSLFLFSFCAKQPGAAENNKKLPEEAQTSTIKLDSSLIAIGDSIAGDFDGDGKIEIAQLRILKEGVFEESPNTLAVVFSNPNIPSIEFTCERDYSTLINEGDLNNSSGDEITIYSPPLGGCTYHMVTYALTNGKWEVVVPLFLIPTACDELSDEQLQSRIFKEKDSIYYYETEPNSLELIKVKVK